MSRHNGFNNMPLGRWVIAWLGIGLLCGIGWAQSGEDLYAFASSKEQQRFEALIGQFRCLVCQNQSLAASDAQLAHDLRQMIYQRVKQGMSDKEIEYFLVSRYGDFVLLKPPWQPSTWLLWMGPGLLLCGGMVIAWRVVRRAVVA